MSHYGDDGYLLPDDNELKLECVECGCEFIDFKSKHADDDGNIIPPFYCDECKYQNKGDKE